MKRKDEIRVIIKQPGSPAFEDMIPNELGAFQDIVSGWIEKDTVGKGIAVISNEEGRLMDMEHNCTVCDIEFVGTIIIAGEKGDHFVDCPLTLEEFSEITSV